MAFMVNSGDGPFGVQKTQIPMEISNQNDPFQIRSGRMGGGTARALQTQTLPDEPNATVNPDHPAMPFHILLTYFQLFLPFN